MAGSLNHIVADDGGFTMDLIENLGDAHEALEECHQFIAYLLAMAAGNAPESDVRATLVQAADDLGFPVPDHTPIIYAGLTGRESIYRKPR